MYYLTNEQIEKVNNFLKSKNGFFDSDNCATVIEENDYFQLLNEIKEKKLKKIEFAKVYESIKSGLVLNKESELKDLININSNNNQIMNQKSKIEELKLSLLKKKQEFEEKKKQKEILLFKIKEQEKELNNYSNKKNEIENQVNFLTNELVTQKKKLIEHIKKLKEKNKQNKKKEKKNKLKEKVNKIMHQLDNYLCLNCKKERSVIVYGNCLHLTYCKSCQDEIQQNDNKYICPICQKESIQKYNVIYN